MIAITWNCGGWTGLETRVSLEWWLLMVYLRVLYPVEACGVRLDTYAFLRNGVAGLFFFH